jgi:hypothetical protein
VDGPRLPRDDPWSFYVFMERDLELDVAGDEVKIVILIRDEVAAR